MKILVTGGAGYIGSHTVKALVAADHTPVVVDNLSRGHRQAVPQNVAFYEMDIASAELAELLKKEKFDGIMHFAAHSQVGESMVKPEIYYENNVVKSSKLIEAARQAGIKHFVFSSTAAVYGEPEEVPIREDALLQPTNVYGRTKLMIEQMLADYSHIHGITYVALRYFNAAGADGEGHIGEDHHPETHLIPVIMQAALGQREAVTVFGTDYPTVDGTCIRDYIHVADLASAHILAMTHLYEGGASRVYNLGTAQGFSVKEIIDTVKDVTGAAFTVLEGERRAGDPAKLIADSSKARKELGWTPVHSDVQTVVGDAWNWHKAHPHGYDK